MKKISFNLESGEIIGTPVMGYARLDHGDALIFEGSRVVMVGKLKSVSLGAKEIPVSGLRLSDLPVNLEDEDEPEEDKIGALEPEKEEAVASEVLVDLSVVGVEAYTEAEVHTTPTKTPRKAPAKAKAGEDNV